MWIADTGALDEPIGPSPLVIDPETTADMYKGGPLGSRPARGCGARGPLAAAHADHRPVQPGQDRSLRAPGALAGPGPPRWSSGSLTSRASATGRCSPALATILIQGPTDEHVIAATEMLEAAVTEMARRLDRHAGVGRPRAGHQDKILADPGLQPARGHRR